MQDQNMALVMKVNSSVAKKEQRALDSFNAGAGVDGGDGHCTQLLSKLFF